MEDPPGYAPIQYVNRGQLRSTGSDSFWDSLTTNWLVEPRQQDAVSSRNMRQEAISEEDEKTARNEWQKGLDRLREQDNRARDAMDRILMEEFDSYFDRDEVAENPRMWWQEADTFTEHLPTLRARLLRYFIIAHVRRQTVSLDSMRELVTLLENDDWDTPITNMAFDGRNATRIRHAYEVRVEQGKATEAEREYYDEVTETARQNRGRN
jgi:hypothetical protein